MNDKEKDNIESPQEKLIVEVMAANNDAPSQAGTTADNDEEEKKAQPTFEQVSRKIATEDESPLSKNFTLSKILGGEILNTSTIRGQIYVLLLITFFLVLYITNRYSCQRSLIEIDKLNKELIDSKYRALSSSSRLTEKSRESHILDILQANNDSTLHSPEQPPFIIEVPQNE